MNPEIINSYTHQINPSPSFTLHKNSMGKWVLKLEDHLDPSNHQEYVEVVVVRAFPIESPSAGISILSCDARELVWIETLDSVSPPQRASLEDALREREFMPEILKLDKVSGFTTPCIWHIQTSRGPTELELKGEEDIRRLSAKTLIVSDRYGVQFLIKDLPQLDRHSRKLLDRFF
jgi:hypothetical protein